MTQNNSRFIQADISLSTASTWCDTLHLLSHLIWDIFLFLSNSKALKLSNFNFVISAVWFERTICTSVSRSVLQQRKGKERRGLEWKLKKLKKLINYIDHKEWIITNYVRLHYVEGHFLSSSCDWTSASIFDYIMSVKPRYPDQKPR